MVRHLVAGVASSAVFAFLALAAVPDAGAADWTGAGYATIHPGIVTETGQGTCTANFVFTDSAGRTYLGQAAHCASVGEGDPTDGCTAPSLPLGTPVVLAGSGVQGTLAYSSWLTMAKRKEKDPSTCASNDFALVRVPEDQRSLVNPSVPAFGGPTGLATGELGSGDAVYSYGNSNLRGSAEALSPQRGSAVGTGADGWFHLAYFVLPGVPGDSGSGVLDADGKARGILVGLNVVPPGSNGITDLAHALAYAQAHSGIKGLALEPGTEKFAP